METSSRRDFALGVVFFGALAMLLYYTIVLTGFSLQEKTYLEAWFPDGAGLKQGDAVLVAGLQAGTVREVAYVDNRAEDRRVQVAMEFEVPITLRDGYLIRISEFTVLGGRVVEINPGPSAARTIGSDTELIGIGETSTIKAFGELVTTNREKIDEIIENVRLASQNIAEGQGALGALLMDEDLKAKVESIVDAAGKIADDIESGAGLLGLLTSDSEARDRVDDIIKNAANAMSGIEEIATQIASGEGLAGAIVYDDQLEADALALVGDIRVSAGELRTALERANSGDGLLGAILTDPSLAEDASAFLANLRAVTDNLAKGEGTLGKLLNEDIAYNELVTALRLLTATLEDLREAQPVSSFAGLLFGTTF
ncbi:MAG: MlaD family protein [Planctomycetes bacterium]|nr:MlaD family protein [Planctomycetota bacterium]